MTTDSVRECPDVLECTNCHSLFKREDRLRIQYPNEEPKVVERMFVPAMDRDFGPYCRNCLRMVAITFNLERPKDQQLDILN